MNIVITGIHTAGKGESAKDFPMEYIVSLDDVRIYKYNKEHYWATAIQPENDRERVEIKITKAQYEKIKKLKLKEPEKVVRSEVKNPVDDLEI